VQPLEVLEVKIAHEPLGSLIRARSVLCDK